MIRFGLFYLYKLVFLSQEDELFERVLSEYLIHPLKLLLLLLFGLDQGSKITMAC